MRKIDITILREKFPEDDRFRGRVFVDTVDFSHKIGCAFDLNKVCSPDCAACAECKGGDGEGDDYHEFIIASCNRGGFGIGKLRDL